MRAIADIAELPKWFQPSQYEKAIELDALGWYWQFQARIHLSFGLTWPVSKEFIKKNPASPQAAFQERMDELLATLKKSPILDISDPIFASKFIDTGFLPAPDPGINRPSLEDIREFLSQLPDEHYAEATAYLSGKHLNSSLNLRQPLSCTSYENAEAIFLRINLKLPEQVLVKNFISLLRQIKNQQNDEMPQVRYRTADLSEWARVGILPYLDLQLWAAEEDVEIPQKIQAQAIFLDKRNEISEEGEDTLRKTTSKLAQQIFNGNILEILSSRQASNV